MYFVSQHSLADWKVGAARIFALALLASGQSASIVATVAGQSVSEGFLHWKVSVIHSSLDFPRALMVVPIAHASPPYYSRPWAYPLRHSRFRRRRKRYKYIAGRNPGCVVHHSSIHHLSARLSHVFITHHDSQVAVQVCISNPNPF